jgi:fatty acid elongase 3
MSLCVGGFFHLAHNLASYATIDYYYYATAGGAKIWVSGLPMLRSIVVPTCVSMLHPQWKKYLTTMQIVQFIVDLHLVYFGSKSEYQYL